MTYQEAIHYIESTAMFSAAPGLERSRALLRALGDPQDTLRFVHVAGTNGKGSTCAMLASILQAAGYKTGLFTSPYLRRFNERIRVNGRSISDSDLAKATEKLKAAVEACGGGFTEFELDTALAMLHFAEKKCAVVVLEVGLGGRLDPTNVIACPDCAVITSIGLDHTAILGDTVLKIAGEKLGIVKEGGAVAMYPPEEDAVFDLAATVCREKGATLRLAEFDELEVLSDGLEGQVFCYCDDTPLTLPLLGDHQLRNAAVVLEAVEILREQGWRIKAEAVEKGLAAARWPGRFELLQTEPAFILDGGHNAQCAGAVAGNLDYYFDGQKKVLLLGIMQDKDVDAFLDVLAPLGDVFVCVTPNSPRAMPAKALAEKLKAYQKPTFVCGSIAEAVAAATRAAGKTGVVCATGSLYMAGDILAHFDREVL